MSGGGWEPPRANGAWFDEQLKHSASFERLKGDITALARKTDEQTRTLNTKLDAQTLELSSKLDDVLTEVKLGHTNPMMILGRALISWKGLLLAVATVLGPTAAAVYALIQLWQGTHPHH
jgi:hypothetical protein